MCSHRGNTEPKSVKGQRGKWQGKPGARGRGGRQVGAEVPRIMAEAITYADLRFVKAPLKKSVSSRLGQGKGG